jgi:hypothetical protein
LHADQSRPRAGLCQEKGGKQGLSPGHELDFPGRIVGRDSYRASAGSRLKEYTLVAKTSHPKLETLGDYQILNKLGDGGTATVYKAAHRTTAELVAVKVLHPELGENTVLLKRFQQEFSVARRVEHPNVVRAIAFGQEGPAHYLVMEYVDGVSLGDKLEAGRMPEPEAVGIILQTAQGLHAAHALGIIHRDIKPDNILVSQDGTAKLTDLGFVKDLDGGLALTRARSGLGTPHFMAAEQFSDAKNADLRCDIYGLGTTLYMAVTGQLPFNGRGLREILDKKTRNDFVAPRQLVPELSERADRAICRAISARPEQRYRSCLEFASDLAGRRVVWTQAVGQAGGNGQESPRAERRASARHPSKQGGLCGPVEGEERFRWFATVQDISAGGIRVLLDRRFESGTILAIELGATADGPSRSLEARVVHVKQTAGKKWMVGCAFTTPLNEGELQALVPTAAPVAPVNGEQSKSHHPSTQIAINPPP